MQIALCVSICSRIKQCCCAFAHGRDSRRRYRRSHLKNLSTRGTVLRFDVAAGVWGGTRVIPTMKKILIVNNNMKIGGVQKSLCNLLWSVADQYDITLYLFAPIGAYMHNIPPQVHVLSCDSLFRLSWHKSKRLFHALAVIISYAVS